MMEGLGLCCVYKWPHALKGPFNCPTCGRTYSERYIEELDTTLAAKAVRAIFEWKEERHDLP